MSEKTLVTLGDDVTINVGSFIQCHSQEDYAFKSDRVAIGSGATIGIGTTVHYGVTIGDGAVIAPESFLMKGEEVPAGEHWGGNPARELPETLRPATPAQLEPSPAAEEPQLLPAPRPVRDDSDALVGAR
jgi:acetyltransferase-like isoleucine patch superfamily enzyme